jgi:hypothetical protein
VTPGKYPTALVLYLEQQYSGCHGLSPEILVRNVWYWEFLKRHPLYITNWQSGKAVCELCDLLIDKLLPPSSMLNQLIAPRLSRFKLTL